MGMARRPAAVQGLSLDDLARRINAEHEQCAAAADAALPHVLVAGMLLIEAKKQVPVGSWGDWLARHCELALKTAQVYMKVARELPERLHADVSVPVARLSTYQALKLLAGPRAPARNRSTLQQPRS